MEHAARCSKTRRKNQYSSTTTIRKYSNKSALKTLDGPVSTDITKKAAILFEGTSLIPTEANLCDIPPHTPHFPLITEDEITRTINNIPNKKAAGPDKIPNELLKIANTTIVPHLAPLFNACLQAHHFPAQWKQAITVIIKKSAKEDYTTPNAYHPIALLKTLSKLFEKIINNRLIYWAEQTKTIHPGHVGGRLGRSINDAFTMLSTWIHHKWQEKKIVIGAFLDFKSAYPMVHKKRLIHSLLVKNFPPYLYLIIDSFLTDRTTKLCLDQYTLHAFNIPTGLPQGSPLSVTHYLLIPGPP
ncbi:hypothetical protein O181_003012 [Austropuccinia psidii MF-1]|uniref:Reverse transcriptase domain-containing protein n=1 Tax=Austropuccinia psidii MF-1 TaxID=1389203 RepID=A0A9Q3BDJ6_9BASI|nr:hypothetical protein [Austropuccinia psidii MF-1]